MTAMPSNSFRHSLPITEEIIVGKVPNYELSVNTLYGLVLISLINSRTNVTSVDTYILYAHTYYLAKYFASKKPNFVSSRKQY